MAHVPQAAELLPEKSHIVRFQNAFDIMQVEPESDGALGWVFNLSAEQLKHVRVETLPEDTTLRRGVKALMLAGGAVGVARGVLTREFE